MSLLLLSKFSLKGDLQWAASRPSMIPRLIQPRLTRVARAFPVIAITGPRQSGKSTLCRETFRHKPVAVLESPSERRLAEQDPAGFLARFPEGAILDEVQRAPMLLSQMLEDVDRVRDPARWILTGSESLMLSQRITQSLAGRVALIELLPMTAMELAGFDQPPRTLAETILLGGFPGVHAPGAIPTEWFRSYISTYIERDVRHAARITDLSAFRRTVAAFAARTAQLANLSKVSNDAGVAVNTVKAWLSVLEATYLVHTLPGWSGSERKRLAKTAKIHLADTGVAASLMGISEGDELQRHPCGGSLFETWVANELFRAQAIAGRHRCLSHWRDQNMVEVDLVAQVGGNVSLIEVKMTQRPEPQMLSAARRVARALPDWLDVRCVLVHGGEETIVDGADQYISWRDVGAFALKVFGADQ